MVSKYRVNEIELLILIYLKNRTRILHSAILDMYLYNIP